MDESVTLSDHGRPTHKVHIMSDATGTEHRWTEWAYCPICLAGKAGHDAEGQPRYSGGKIRIQYRHPRGALRLTEGACTCIHGEKWEATFLPFLAFSVGQELNVKHHGVCGTVVKIWIPGEGQGIRLERMKP